MVKASTILHPSALSSLQPILTFRDLSFHHLSLLLANNHRQRTLVDDNVNTNDFRRLRRLP